MGYLPSYLRVDSYLMDEHLLVKIFAQELQLRVLVPSSFSIIGNKTTGDCAIKKETQCLYFLQRCIICNSCNDLHVGDREGDPPHLASAPIS